MKIESTLSFIAGLLLSASIFCNYIKHFKKEKTNNQHPELLINIRQKNTESNFYHDLINKVLVKNNTNSILVFPNENCHFYCKFRESTIRIDYYEHMLKLGTHRLYLVLYNIVYKLYNYSDSEIPVITENKNIFYNLLSGMTYESIDSTDKFGNMNSEICVLVTRFLNIFCKPVDAKYILQLKIRFLATNWYKETIEYLVRNDTLKEVYKICLVTDNANTTFVTVLDYFLITLQNLMNTKLKNYEHKLKC